MRFFENNIIVFLVILILASCSTSTNKIQFKIEDRTVSTLDDRVFGQFLEKPSWHGEWGPEAALVPGTHKLQGGVVNLMEEMDIPVLRFPGGTDVDITNWQDMISNIPGRNNERPLFIGHTGDTVAVNFGYDEACHLAEKLGSEMIIVVNFGDAYFGRKTIEKAACHEAGLIAYLNAEVGARLPENMPDWPALRAKNGRKEPYNVRYVQIANEPWVMDRELKRMAPIDETKKEQYFKCLDAYINMIKKVDPDVEIIADGNCKELTLPLREKFGEKIDYIAYHLYMPWAINEIIKDTTKLTRDEVTEEEVWNAWVTVPQINNAGFSVIDNNVFNMSKSTGYPIAVTEWNWNGWWGMNSVEQDNLGSHFTKGIGAGGFIHALMREAGHIPIGIQSMLVGRSWGITGIRVSELEEFEPHPYPTGQITGFYSKYHGNQVLEVQANNIPFFVQPYKMSGLQPHDKVNYIDAIVTKSENRIYFHAINRHYSDDLDITIDLNDFENIGEKAVHHKFEGSIKNESCDVNKIRFGCFSDKGLKLKGNKLNAVLPKRSASIIEIQLKK